MILKIEMIQNWKPSVPFWTSIVQYKDQSKNFSIDTFSTIIELLIDTMGGTKTVDLT